MGELIMTRSFAGGVVREVEIIAERLVPKMDGMPMDWEQRLFGPAAELREQLLAFEAWKVEKDQIKRSAA